MAPLHDAAEKGDGPVREKGTLSLSVTQSRPAIICLGFGEAERAPAERGVRPAPGRRRGGGRQGREVVRLPQCVHEL